MRNLRLFKCVAVTVAALIMVMMAGCGSAVLTRPQPLAGVQTYLVTGNCEIAVEDGQIIVSGETDILDGAQIHVSVVAQNGMVLDYTVFTKTDDVFSRSFVITDEKYEGTEQVTGYITCAPSTYGAQPQNVIDAYGKQFEQVDVETKDNIWNNNGVIIIFASETIDLQ